MTDEALLICISLGHWQPMTDLSTSNRITFRDCPVLTWPITHAYSHVPGNAIAHTHTHAWPLMFIRHHPLFYSLLFGSQWSWVLPPDSIHKQDSLRKLKSLSFSFYFHYTTNRNGGFYMKYCNLSIYIVSSSGRWLLSQRMLSKK